MKHPVVVELYSPRVATGQQLSDALIEIANASDGKFLLARLNVDAAPGIVQALGLQAVPTVIALIGGQAAPLFQGVLPKDQVQAAIDQLLTAAVANGIIGRADPVGGAPAEDDDEAEEPEADPRFAAADEAFARGDFEAAATSSTSCCRPIRPTPKLRPARPRPACSPALLRWTGRRCWPRPTEDDLETQLAAADVEMITGDAEAAFARLIALIKKVRATSATRYDSGCSSSSRPSATATSGSSRPVAT